MNALESHVALLSDRRRLDAFATAITAQVHHGNVVADLGSGIGILAILAARAGAKRVYAVESEHEVGRWIEPLAAANGCGDRVVYCPGDSRELDVPEPVDIVIYDDFDILDPRTTWVSTLSDARERWAPGGIFLPSTCSLMATPCEAIEPTATGPIDLGPVRDHLARIPRPVRLGSSELLLAKGQALLSGPVESVGANDFSASVQFTAARPGSIGGVLLWLELGFGDDHDLDLGPGTLPSAYPQILLPLSGIHVGQGDPIQVELGYKGPAAREGHHRFWNWSVRTPSGEVRGSSFDTLDLSALVP